MQAEEAQISKKRKFKDIEDTTVIAKSTTDLVPKTKKIKANRKLDVLGKIENHGGFNAFLEEPRTPTSKNKWGFKELPKTPPSAGFKIKSLVSKQLSIRTVKKREKSGEKKIPDSKNFLGKPVWTSSGEFLEEPYKNDSKQIHLTSARNDVSTQFFVTALCPDKKKNKTASQEKTAAWNFKQNAFNRKGMIRSNSKKLLEKSSKK